jgi:hypothetical protein
VESCRSLGIVPAVYPARIAGLAARGPGAGRAGVGFLLGRARGLHALDRKSSRTVRAILSTHANMTWLTTPIRNRRPDYR